MAYIAADAIIQRLRELVQDGDGSYRAIDGGRLQGGLATGLSAEEQRRRGMYTEKPAEISLDALNPHPQRLTYSGSIQYHLLSITIRIVRTIAIAEQHTDALRDDIRAQAIVDGSALQHVMSLPVNLAATEAATPTGILGARFLGSTFRVEGTVGETMSLVTDHRFELTVTSTPAAS